MSGFSGLTGCPWPTHILQVHFDHLAVQRCGHSLTLHPMHRVSLDLLAVERTRHGVSLHERHQIVVLVDAPDDLIKVYDDTLFLIQRTTHILVVR